MAARLTSYHGRTGPLAAWSEFFRRFLHVRFRSPRRIQVGITDRCNLGCRMCPRDGGDTGGDQMSIEGYRELLKTLPRSVRRLILTGWGEPLMHPDLVRMVDLAVQQGLLTQLTTNGTLLDDSLRRRLVEAGLHYMVVSVDSLDGSVVSGHTSVDAIPNIERFAAVRGDRGPHLTVQATMHPDSDRRLPEIVEWAARIGVDRVNLVRLNRAGENGPNRPSAVAEKSMLRAAVAAGRRSGILVEHEGARGRGLTRLGWMLLRPLLYRRDNSCPVLLDALYVRPDGKITPCCSLPESVVGSVADGFPDAWSGGLMGRFLEGQGTICRHCDTMKLHQTGSGDSE